MIYRLLQFIVAACLTACSASNEILSESSEALRIIPGDTCATAPTVTLAQTIMTITGTTTGHTDDYSISSVVCGDQRPASAPDVVVQVVVPQLAVFDAQVFALSSGFEPALYLRLASSCSTERFCWDYGATSVHVHQLMLPGTYAIIVDGRNSTRGSFRLQMSLTSPSCGDGVVEDGEQCDGAGADPVDGCGNPGTPNACQFEAPNPVADALPGSALTLPLGETMIQGTTNGYDDSVQGSCAVSAGGSDRFYTFTPAADGLLTASIGLDVDGITEICDLDTADPGCWDRVTYLLEWSGTAWAPATGQPGDITCSDLGAYDVEVVQAHVQTGQQYALAVDGYDDQWYSRGPYYLRVDLQ